MTVKLKGRRTGTLTGRLTGRPSLPLPRRSAGPARRPWWTCAANVVRRRRLPWCLLRRWRPAASDRNGSSRRRCSRNRNRNRNRNGNRNRNSKPNLSRKQRRPARPCK